MHSSGFFSDKAYCKVDFKREISGSHMISDQSLLLSTNVLNDSVKCKRLKVQKPLAGVATVYAVIFEGRNFRGFRC